VEEGRPNGHVFRDLNERSEAKLAVSILAGFIWSVFTGPSFNSKKQSDWLSKGMLLTYDSH